MWSTVAAWCATSSPARRPVASTVSQRRHLPEGLGSESNAIGAKLGEGVAGGETRPWFVIVGVVT
jgi:hypothetical protein